jgi:hypothetical protein
MRELVRRIGEWMQAHRRYEEAGTVGADDDALNATGDAEHEIFLELGHLRVKTLGGLAAAIHAINLALHCPEHEVEGRRQVVLAHLAEEADRYLEAHAQKRVA